MWNLLKYMVWVSDFMQGMAFHFWIWGFENDVKMYGTQASGSADPLCSTFENDVKMYGTQAQQNRQMNLGKFENDVKMYGTQAVRWWLMNFTGLRMM